jgi:hypothetical protein
MGADVAKDGQQPASAVPGRVENSEPDRPTEPQPDLLLDLPADEDRVPFARVLDPLGGENNAGPGPALSADYFNRQTTTSHGVRFCDRNRPTKGEARWFCGRIRACVGCSRRRAKEVLDLILEPVAAAPHVLALSLGIAHRGASLQAEWDDLRRVRRRFTERGTWSSFQKRNRLDGVVIAAELTVGRDGWHPHLHLLLTASQRIPGAVRDRIADDLLRRWLRAAEHEGIAASPHAQTADWVPRGFDRHRAAEYVTKGSLEHRGKHENHTPGDLLVLASRGDADADEALEEYRDVVRNGALPPLHVYGNRFRIARAASADQKKKRAAA